jgi:poly-gamma-glutamate synthesis protein (capsule biosynthesis protein)
VGAIIDEKTFDKEHSITAVVPFIKYYFPETEIVPIIIGEGTKRADIDNLAKTLKNIAPQDSIVLVSVDFSHYLSVEAAKFHDTKAIATIKSFDIDEIRKLEIDSRPAITVLLKYLQSQKAERMDYWNYSSALIKNDKYDNHVSSYLYAYFSEGERIYEPVVSFLNFGDAMFGRNVGEKIKKGLDPFLFIRGPQNTRLFFQGLDFITLNLEGPITENEKCQKKAYSFRFATTTGQLLKENGIFLVNLANNHSFDCYQTGLNDTKKFLTNSNVSYMGGGDLEKSYTEKHAGGKKIAFIGIDLSINSNFDLAYLELIKKLKKRNDYVVVNIHWGVEYNKEATKTQKDVGHKIIDAGADAIIGHHPHVIEPLEIYKGKPIFYSLGNFIFDQIGYEENRGIGAGIIFKNSSTTVQIFPYEITNHQPKLLLPEEAERFCGNFLKSLNVSTTTPCSFSI